MKNEVTDNKPAYERRVIEWHRLHETEEQNYLHIIDGYLSQGTEEAKEAICNLAETGDFVEIFKTRNEISYVITAINIYYRELEADVVHTIFDKAHSVDELIRIINRIRFYIWELEYTDDETSAYMLCEYIQNMNISVVMLIYLLDIASLDAYMVSIKLSEALRSKHMYSCQLHVLLHALEQRPGDEAVLCELVQLYMKVGKTELAKECLEEISHPGMITERVRKLYGF